MANNVLTINYDRNQDAAGNIQYKSGGIISKQTFGYGFYEVKAKLYRATKGLHQSFWTMGLNPKEPSASSPTADPDQYQLVANDLLPAFNTALEIDGFEQNSKDGFLASNHHVYTPFQTSSVNQLTRPNPGTDWFRMGFLWTPTYIKFFYRSETNGQWVAVATKSLTTDGGKWDVYAPQNFWLTALATPEYPTWWDGETRSPASDAAMQVGYFKYYAKIQPGVNLIGNAGFEYSNRADASGNYPIGWIETRNYGFDPERSAVTTNIANTNYGSRYLVHESHPTPYKCTTKQILEYIPFGNYKLTAHVRSSGGQRMAAMRVIQGGVERLINIPASSA
ncbi:MAG: glycoside hydrolase family 16 protein [Spirosoma sp.]|nr:glycoside hydrolase family 16 protein [Spirosoma sp.]